MTYTVVARNNAVASSNRMHDDTVAQNYGFSGGLVPGADVWAYLAHPPLERWGLDWLAQGTMEARFRSPFYEGDVVDVAVEEEGDGALALRAVNAAGVLCATGRATRHAPDTAPPLSLDGVPAAPLPPWPPPAASYEHFASHPVLGTLETPWTADLAGPYLESVGETSALLRDGAVAPPGWLARLTDFVLVANATLGPWIFAEARLRHLGLVHDGDVVSTRARVAALYERKGHRFVELDLLMVTGTDRPVVCGRKTAIYEPRST